MKARRTIRVAVPSRRYPPFAVPVIRIGAALPDVQKQLFMPIFLRLRSIRENDETWRKYYRLKDRNRCAPDRKQCADQLTQYLSRNRLKARRTIRVAVPSRRYPPFAVPVIRISIAPRERRALALGGAKVA